MLTNRTKSNNIKIPLNNNFCKMYIIFLIRTEHKKNQISCSKCVNVINFYNLLKLKYFCLVFSFVFKQLFSFIYKKKTYLFVFFSICLSL